VSLLNIFDLLALYSPCGTTTNIVQPFSFDSNELRWCETMGRRVCIARSRSMTASWSMQLMTHSRIALVVALAWFGLAVPALATPDQLIFGAKQYVRTTGAPNQFTDTIAMPPTVGPPFLLHVVNGQSNGQNRISSAWIEVNNVQVAGPADFGQNVAVVDQTITLNPGTNQLKVRLASTPGAFLTVSVYGTKILSTPTALTPNPLSLTVGSSGTLTATLSPAPTTAGALTVASNNTAVATVPSSVNFTLGQTSIAIPVTAVAVGNAQITVTLNDGSVSATVDVSTAPPTITSLQPASATITQGGTGNLTVTISAAQSSATIVSLSSSASSMASVPASVTIPAGQTTTTIPVSGNTPGTAVITAGLNGTSATSTITVTPNLPTIVAVEPPTTSLNLGAIGTLTVRISAVQSSVTPIQVTTAPTGIVTVPATVSVPAGQLTTTIPVTAAALGSAMVHVTLNSSMAEALVQVTPPPPAIVSLLPSPLPVVIGASGTLTVTLNAGQLTNTEVAVTVDQPSLVQVPAIVTVPAGQTSAAFTVTGLAVGNAIVTATVNGTTKTATVQVQPPPPAVVALLPNPLPLQQGATGSLTLTINAAQVSDTVISLTNSAPTLVQVPASITVPANQLTVTIPVTALLAGNATITASINSTTASSVVQVTLPPPVVTSLTPLTQSLPKGRPGTLTVTLSRAPTDVTVVTLTSSATNVAQVPASVTVAAGALTATFPVNTVGEGTATITASLNGGSATATITVTPAELVLLTLSPQDLSLFVGEQQPMTATATLTDGTTQNLTTDSRLVWASTNQTVATITTEGVISALAVGATTIRATFTPTTGQPTIVETGLTVLTPPALSLTATPTTLAVGQALSVTVTSARVADIGGLAVTITSAGTGAVSHATTVTIPENQTATTVVVTGVTPGAVTLTATAPIRIPATLGLTVTFPPPTITSFSPTSGVIGTVVTITGTNLNGTGPGTTTVKFNNTNAIITSVSATSLTTTVPQGATNGRISIVTPGGTATSTVDFTVQNALDFTLMPLPGTVSVAQVGSTTYQVKVTNAGPSSFTGFVNLNVSGLPTGVTASFNPSQATVSQPSTLILTSTASATPGTYPLLITGSGSIDGGVVQRIAQAQLTILQAGTSTLSGRVLAAKDSVPIPGVTVKLNSQTTTTDAGGNFVMQNVPAGPQIVFIDGETASNAQVLYPIVPVPVTIVAGQDNHLPWAAYLHEMSRNYTPINPSQETVVTDPTVPNFELRIPAGAQIIGWDGQPNTRVSVSVVPVDRNALAPVESADGRLSTDLYLFNFGKPGGGNPTQPIPITLPNTWGNFPGTAVDLYYYDESLTPDPNSNQWKLFGQGHVSDDGTKIVSDPGVGIPKFCCGGGRGGPPPPPAPPDPNPLPTGTDPVILTTGQFTYEATDLVLPGRVPIVIQRAYRSLDPRFSLPSTVGIFGSLTTLLDYNETLGPPPSQFLPAAQVMIYGTNFGQALFARQPDGTFINTTSTRMRGMVVTFNSDFSRQIRMLDGSIRRFNTTGFLVEIEDRVGNKVTIVRSPTTQLIQEIREPSGRAIVFQYDVANRITQITDPIGRTVRYTYDAQGRLAQVRNPEGGVTSYIYDFAFRIVSITDPRGITYLTNEYDNAGRVVRQTQVDTGVWTLAYTVVANRIMQTIVTDPRGNQTTHRFNAQGGEVETVDALGQVTRRTFEVGTNRLQEVRDPLNRVSKLAYDAVGNVTAVTDPNNQVTRLEYHPIWNRVTKITDALNQIAEFTYDAAGNLLTVKDPLQHTTTLTYNAFGQPLTVTDPLNQTTTFTYDNAGNLIATADPLGNTTQRAYDQVNRLIAITDPRGFATEFQYDGLNRVTQITDALNGLTHFAYDPNSNLLTVTDAKNQATTYTYDTMDRLATRKDALNRTENYQYDLAGNLSQFTDRKNQVTTFQYDALNRRTKAIYVDSTTTFAYDAVGRLTKASDTAPGAGSVDFAYDALDRLIQETTGQGMVSYQYDVIGRRTNMVANGQQPVTYGYDAASRLTQVAQGSLTVGLGYDNSNRRTSLTYPNGTSTSYTYDVASRLTNINHTGPSGIIEALTYHYDAAGNRTSLTRANGAASLLPTAVASASYDSANEQTAFAGATLTYDQNGNLTSDGTNTYQWDARNRLIGIGGGTTASFNYDALGRRSSKTISSTSSQLLYDGKDIAAEIGGGAVGANYLRSLNIDRPFVRQSATGNEFYHTDALGSLLAMSNALGVSTTTYNYEPFGKTTVTGTSANAFQYTGRENDGAGLYYYRARYYSASFQRFIEEDPILGVMTAANFCSSVIRNKTVWIVPSLINGGRSLAGFKEPLVEPTRITNAYAYVGNNSQNFIDPLGLDKESDNERECDAGALFKCRTENAGELLGCLRTATIICVGTRLPQVCVAGAALCAGRYGFGDAFCRVESNCY
jgi:RHS repeat-associated protein